MTTADRSDGIEKYIGLERKLSDWRAQHPEDTPEEDAILDEMEFLWRDLTQPERDWLELHHFRKGTRKE